MNEDIRHLEWSVKYYRKEQAERVVEHLKAGKSLWTFLGSTGEHHLDSLLSAAANVLKDLEEEQNKPTRLQKLQFWKK